MKNYALLLLAGLATACNQSAPQTPAAVSSAPAATADTPAATADAPAQTAAPATIDVAKAKELLKQPGTQVLDVRTSPEYMLGHLPQAKNLNVNSDDFAQQVAQLDTSKTYVVYCGSGVRSAKAAEQMAQKGFHHVVNGGGYGDLK
ncbi:rhodanese-like domain-containing protein [Hymenobacter sp. RP-2-7]|uniref:Rhodanese-like domain-containing protein n=1 Tax=Hymenobacter polaris TaxID=2682546 RepID=A0A7Y0AEX4_9BACT|nr:rhodanese-like domain-containing protein [Hymenobacter polaris]NML66109.1 rhodanese-like domain-containing protein [Hymenobacter polaris]